MKTLLLDLDGTIFRGSVPVEGAVEFVDKLIQEEIPFLFLTNNARRTKEQNKQHMLDMGFRNITGDMFYTSAMAAASYAKRNYDVETAYYIGEDGLKEAIESQGMRSVGEDEQAGVVFVGLDIHATYTTYSKALHQLNGGAKLIGTNDDRRLSTSTGFDIGNGSIVKMLEYASSQTSPQIGKPHAVMLEEMLHVFPYKKEECIMVGDNLETDVLFGLENGLDTIFITTGVHCREDMDVVNVHPTNIVDTLEEVYAYVKK